MRTLLATALILSATASLAAAPPFEVGKPAPTLALPASDDGRQLSVLDFRGKKVVLHVFASW